MVAGVRSLLICAALMPLTAWAGVSVNAVRLWAGPDSTRVVMDLDAPADHRIFHLRDPSRIVVDLTQARLAASAMPDGAGAVTRIRSGKRDGGDLRVVLDLSVDAIQPRSVILPPNDVYGHRLVIDLFPQGSEAARSAAPVIAQQRREVLVAIDPGHGGEDPGAIGRRGTREKSVVLQIARRLAEQINAQPGMRAMLTRNGDYFLTHRNRWQKARDQRADFFVSIHADAFKDRRAHGSSVYALSERAATDEAARWLAERENAADLIGGVSLDDKDDLLASVLLDLSQNAAISSSLNAGSFLLDELGAINDLRRKEVQQANFLVLKSPDIPSLLVETAFISNPEEEKRLLNAAYQEKIAAAIMRGIRGYFARNAPPGTQLAQARGADGDLAYRHVIGSGETLSEIAARYKVKMQEIRSANDLHGDVIRVGQVLAIPLAR
ncbi:MAG: N-acetylmuramoyl-L-alanine amidase [Gammaproteobacteria bacterium]|nr:N-acetylmuramoyl-L-alanine amidase [Gammaproteobacteria bacterium]NNF60293.1 AMIN domain-containing protein [Gammaproteobacteria bacterium]NNM20401.1 AMIN domain-containing protein [Gammaproteobacteria bacterium]